MVIVAISIEFGTTEHYCAVNYEDIGKKFGSLPRKSKSIELSYIHIPKKKSLVQAVNHGQHRL